MTIMEAILLGIVQGLSEFLPISSSGHLALGQALLGIETGDVTFEVIVHFGTVLAVLTVLRERVMRMLVGVVKGDATERSLALQIVVGTIPAGVIGLLFEDALSAAFADPRAVSMLLLATGCVLFSSRWARGDRARTGWVDAMLMGFAQALAILPGISRSGMTITTGMWRGVSGREAATFSFLLAIPVIVGATVLKVSDLMDTQPDAAMLTVLAAGLVAAYVSGVIAIRWLLRVLEGGRLDRFAYYCWAVGLAGVVVFAG